MRSRQRGQAVVEFGLIALIFTLLMFAVVDLGLLLNSWVRLSAATREVGRGASVGYTAADLQSMVQALVLPGVNRNLNAGHCCAPGDAVVLSVNYYPHCLPGGGCNPVGPGQLRGNVWPGSGTCSDPPLPAVPTCHPLAGDTIVVSLTAPGMEVLTPLVRPFFGCNGASLHCYVQLGNTAMLRYEGP